MMTNPKQLDFGLGDPEQAEHFAQELQDDPPSKVEAEFLQLPPVLWTYLAQVHPGNGVPVDPPGMSGNMPHPSIYCMPLWQGHQETLVLQAFC